VARFASEERAGSDRPAGVRRLDIDLCDDDGEVCVRLRGFQVRTAGDGAAPTATAPSTATSPVASTPTAREAVTPRQPEEADADAQLLHLIQAVGEGALSADEFQRSLI
jgi:hypothetical protein